MNGSSTLFVHLKSLRHGTQIFYLHVNKHGISTIVLNNLQKQDVKNILLNNLLIRERPKWIKIISRISIVLSKKK